MHARLAARARLPWILLAGAVGTTAIVAGLGALGGQRGRSPRAATPASASPPARVELHVKLAPGATLAGSRPLFTALPAGTHDGRERWRVLEVGADVALALSIDPRIEAELIPPTLALPTAADILDTDADDDADEFPPARGSSCPITTPSYEAQQGYVGPAPGGIDAPSAWTRGVRGQGEWFADIEGGWNAAHEDLPGERIRHVYGVPMKDTTWRAHGTAVLGEVAGRDNGKGVVGLAPEVERILTASIGGGTPADAIDTAAEQLRAGDVLLIELQATGPRGRYIAVEYWDDVYAAIHAATARGVVVVEAAGNGAEDLDHRAYRGAFDRTRRDSGAILVGAGAPARHGYTDRARLDFSNYGSRVDVQGWGRKVATLEYGDLQACDDQTRDRHYTGEFSGTSSASPIVASAAVLLESVARRSGHVWSPADVRALLVATGTPQTGDLRQHIGPRPDLARALPHIAP